MARPRRRVRKQTTTGVLQQRLWARRTASRRLSRISDLTATYCWRAACGTTSVKRGSSSPGLPEEIGHIVGAHSYTREEAWVVDSLESTIIQCADIAYWEILGAGGLMEEKK